MRKLLLIIIVVAGVLFSLWLLYGLFPANLADNTRVTVAVQPGMSVSAIVEVLHDKHLIRSPLAFTLYVRYKGFASSLKAGAFTFSRSQSVPGIVSALVEGKSEEVVITIPEGLTVADIDELLASKGLGKQGDLLDCAFSCDFTEYTFLPDWITPRGTPREHAKREDGYGSGLEGYLFPDTYYVSTAGYQSKQFLERMLTNFESKIVDVYGPEIQKSDRSMADILAMASLVQEESRGDEDERMTVSGILWKRLDGKIALGVDATVRYALRKPKIALTKEDLQFDSPYNTRKHGGLPPTPIANPGEEAIKAALRPKVTEYWYYLHDTDGKIHYAKTNDEHNENRARYLR